VFATSLHEETGGASDPTRRAQLATRTSHQMQTGQVLGHENMGVIAEVGPR